MTEVSGAGLAGGVARKAPNNTLKAAPSTSETSGNSPAVPAQLDFNFDEETQSTFLFGDCNRLALVLNRLFGLEIYGVVEPPNDIPFHYGCRIGDMMVDASGLRGRDDFVKRTAAELNVRAKAYRSFDAERLRLMRVSPCSTENPFYMEEGNVQFGSSCRYRAGYLQAVAVAWRVMEKLQLAGKWPLASHCRSRLLRAFYRCDAARGYVISSERYMGDCAGDALAARSVVVPVARGDLSSRSGAAATVRKRGVPCVGCGAQGCLDGYCAPSFLAWSIRLQTEVVIKIIFPQALRHSNLTAVVEIYREAADAGVAVPIIESGIIVPSPGFPFPGFPSRPSRGRGGALFPDTIGYVVSVKYHGWLRDLDAAGAKRVLEKLSALHNRGIGHGDLHPGNVVYVASEDVYFANFENAFWLRSIRDIAPSLETFGWPSNSRNFVRAERDFWVRTLAQKENEGKHPN